MSGKEAPKPAAGAAVDGMPKKKICCSCPETKRLRDECLPVHGPDHVYCKALIEAHRQCLRLEGFDV